MSNGQAQYAAGRGFTTLGPSVGTMTLNDVVASQQRGYGFNDWWKQAGSSGQIFRGTAVNSNWLTHTPRNIREGTGPLKAPHPISTGKKLYATAKQPNAITKTRALLHAPYRTGGFTREDRGGVDEVGAPSGGGWPGGPLSTGERSHTLYNVTSRDYGEPVGALESGVGALPPGSQFPALGMGNFPAVQGD